MARPDLRMSFADAEALARECDSNLKHGRGFVHNATGIAVLSDCTLVLEHPASGRTLSILAQAVMVVDDGPMRGVGLQLRPFDAVLRDRIERFVAGDADAADAGSREAVAATEGATRDAAVLQGEAEAEPASDGNAAEAARLAGDDAAVDADAGVNADAGDALEDEVDEDADTTSDGDEGDDLPIEQRADLHTQARIDVLRKLSHTQRQKLARKGELQDRVILERVFGRDLWPQLLQNPKLTLPEVARIGRKRSVPQPLLTLIVDNNTWIQASVVRRALLSNPRIGHEAVDKLIRITPKHELKLMMSTLAYSGYVRDAARRALKKD